MTAPPPLAALSRIAVLRASGMGDYLMLEPALAALRAAAPDARLTLLGGTWAAAALPGRPGPVDEVVLVPVIDGVRGPRPGERPDPGLLTAFYEEMRGRGFDLALQLHGGGRNSNPVVLGLGAAFTAGLRAFDAPALDLSVSYQYWQHEILRNLEVMAALGAGAVRVHPRFAVTDRDRQAAAGVLRAAGIGAQAPFVVLHPGATDPRRRWPPASFAAVADALSERGLTVLVIGSPAEATVVRRVAALCRAAVALTDLSVPALVGVLDRALLLVGNDSGPRHLADALGRPTVAVYWCGNMISAAPAGRDRHRVHTSWTTRCPVCGVSCIGEPFPAACSDTVTFVSDVPVETVVRSAIELLGEA